MGGLCLARAFVPCRKSCKTLQDGGRGQALLGERRARNHSQCRAEQELQAMAEFWDTHSLADYWDQTEPTDFEVAPEARRRYLVAVDREVLARVQRLARLRGVSSESLVNLLLEQRLQEVESQVAKA